MCFRQIYKHFSFNASSIKGLCLGLLFSCQFLLGSFVEERLTPFPQQTQASALRSPSLQQASVSSLLLLHSCKCSENFIIKWFPCSPRNSENLCRKWQKKLLYLQKFTKEASLGNRKKKQNKTDNWFAKSGN